MTTNKNYKNLLICNSSFYGSEKLKNYHIKNYNILKKNFSNSSELYEFLKKEKKEINAILISLETPIDKKHFKFLSKLSFIFTPTTGVTHIKDKPTNVKIFNLNTKDELIKRVSSTPELIIGLIIGYYRKLFFAVNNVKKNNWQRNNFIGNNIKNKTIGIIGHGRIGKKLEIYSKVLGMKVLIFEKKKNQKKNNFVTMNNLLKNSDIVSLNINYNENLYKYFNYKYFKLMKKNSLFINTSRGELVSENCLIKALNNKIISGAALDVLSDQQVGKKIKNKKIYNYLKNNDNLIITPHIGGATYESFRIVKDYTLNLCKKILNIK